MLGSLYEYIFLFLSSKYLGGGWDYEIGVCLTFSETGFQTACNILYSHKGMIGLAPPPSCQSLAWSVMLLLTPPW